MKKNNPAIYNELRLLDESVNLLLAHDAEHIQDIKNIKTVLNIQHGRMDVIEKSIQDTKELLKRLERKADTINEYYSCMADLNKKHIDLKRHIDAALRSFQESKINSNIQKMLDDVKERHTTLSIMIGVSESKLHKIEKTIEKFFKGITFRVEQ